MPGEPREAQKQAGGEGPVSELQAVQQKAAPTDFFRKRSEKQGEAHNCQQLAGRPNQRRGFREVEGSDDGSEEDRAFPGDQLDGRIQPQNDQPSAGGDARRVDQASPEVAKPVAAGDGPRHHHAPERKTEPSDRIERRGPRFIAAPVHPTRLRRTQRPRPRRATSIRARKPEIPRDLGLRSRLSMAANPWCPGCPEVGRDSSIAWDQNVRFTWTTGAVRRFIGASRSRLDPPC